MHKYKMIPTVRDCDKCIKYDENDRNKYPCIECIHRVLNDHFKAKDYDNKNGEKPA